MTTARPAVQEEVSTGRVTEVVVPVQGFQATKPDTSIKDTKATRKATNHQGSQQQQQSGYQSNPKQLNSGQYHVFTTTLCKHDQKLHKRAVNSVEPAVP
mgnify:CR=1 FL=1